MLKLACRVLLANMIAFQPSILDLNPPALAEGVILYDSPLVGEFLADLSVAPYFALDIETFGEDKYDGLLPRKGCIRLIQVTLPNNKTLIVDLGSFFDDRIFRWAEVCLIVKSILDAVENPNQAVIGHNIKFDLLWLKTKYGTEAKNVRDTMLLSLLYWHGIKVYEHNLGALADRVLGEKVDKTLQKSNWGDPLTIDQLNYAAKDTVATLAIYKKLSRMCLEAGIKDSCLIECGAIPAFVDMEANGFPINKAKCKAALDAYMSAQKTEEAVFNTYLPCKITASSPTLVAQFQDKLGITLISTADNELQSSQDHEAITALCNYRSLKKGVDYLKSLVGSESEDHVFTSFRQLTSTSFGRSTSARLADRTGVNLQNCPKDFKDPALLKHNLPSIRACFGVPEGRSLIISDLSAAHARIAAQATQDDVLLKVFLEDMDAHSIIAADLAQEEKLGESWKPENIAKWRKDKTNANYKKANTFRDAAKNCLYGGLNVQGKATLQATVAKIGIQMSLEACEVAIKGFRKLYPGIYAYQKRIHTEANKQLHKFGLACDFGSHYGLSGRRTFLAKWENKFRPGSYEVKISDVCSFTWMSTEADIMKIAIAEVHEKFLNNPHWEARLCNLCHDELNAECNSTYELEVATVVCEAMDKAMAIYIKDLPVNEANATPVAAIARSWADK